MIQVRPILLVDALVELGKAKSLIHDGSAVYSQEAAKIKEHIDQAADLIRDAVRETDEEQQS